MKPFQNTPEIPQEMLDTLNILGFSTMTPIQEKAIPPILEQKDILAQSKTGSGKTLAFGIPGILKTNMGNNRPQTLIITPTRELAEQVATVLRQLAAYRPNLKIVTLYGGVPLRAQADSLAKGAHILIGTPGRIQDHLAKGTLELKSIETFILDEADRMLDMGFYDEIVKIGSNMPKGRQTLLFSATFPEKIEKLAKALLKEPLTIKVDTLQKADKIEEIVYEASHKFKALSALIGSYRPQSLLIFCNTKAEVISLAERLTKQGNTVVSLHGDLDQRERNEAVIAFSNGTKPVMVATDVASRGLDIAGIETVINYDLPFDKEVYTHRIGRTGRSDAVGTAISLHTPGSDKTAYIYDLAIKKDLSSLRTDASYTLSSEFATLCIHGGKKTKLRKGDILGALCKEIGLDNKYIGKIDISDTKSYVALHQCIIGKVLKALKSSVKIKKKKYICWILD